MRAIAAFQETRWFINTFTYFPLSFCSEKAHRSLSKDLMVVKKSQGNEAYLVIQIISMLKKASRGSISTFKFKIFGAGEVNVDLPLREREREREKSLTYLPHI